MQELQVKDTEIDSLKRKLKELREAQDSKGAGGKDSEAAKERDKLKQDLTVKEVMITQLTKEKESLTLTVQQMSMKLAMMMAQGGKK